MLSFNWDMIDRRDVMKFGSNTVDVNFILIKAHKNSLIPLFLGKEKSLLLSNLKILTVLVQKGAYRPMTVKR